MNGLAGVYKDFTNNESFDELHEFNEYIQSTGKRDVIGSFRCALCLKKFNHSDTPANCVIDAVNGGTAVYHCDDCLADLAREYAGTGGAQE